MALPVLLLALLLGAASAAAPPKPVKACLPLLKPGAKGTAKVKNVNSAYKLLQYAPGLMAQLESTNASEAFSGTLLLPSDTAMGDLLVNLLASYFDRTNYFKIGDFLKLNGSASLDALLARVPSQAGPWAQRLFNAHTLTGKAAVFSKRGKAAVAYATMAGGTVRTPANNALRVINAQSYTDNVTAKVIAGPYK